VRGEGGILRTPGRRLHETLRSARLLAPRDYVARAIDAEIKRSGPMRVFFRYHRQAGGILRERFPKYLRDLFRFGMT